MLVEVFRKNKSGVILISLLLALLSFYWVPPSYFDKAHYIVFYDDYKALSFSTFSAIILATKSDFIFYLIFYICGALNMKFYFCIALITFFTSYFIHNFFFKISSAIPIDKKYFIWFFFGITMSISYAYFFSGIRFYLAIALFLQSIYYLHQGNRKMFITIFLIATLTHFGVLSFLPGILLYTFFKNKS